MKSKSSVRTISIILALVSIGICLVFWGLVSGLEKGYFYGVFQDPPHMGFAVHAPNFFSVTNTWYFIIAIGFSVYIIGKFLKSLIASTIVCILSLSVALYPFWDMYFYKREVLGIETRFSYDYWLRISTYFDWFLFCTAIVLMIMQFFLVLRRTPDFEKLKIV